jgi:Helix-turn-helix domain
VSVEAISWALNLAPVPADRGGQPSSACKFVLVGLANHAGPDGTGAFPSVATLVRHTGLAERTVRTCLDGCKPKASSHRVTRTLLRRGSSAPTAGPRAGTSTWPWSAATWTMPPSGHWSASSPG